MATAPKKSAKKPGTAVVAWQDQMSAAAKKQAAVEKVTGSFRTISTRGGILSVDDNALPDNELRAVVVCSAHENQYYEGAFNPNQLSVPVCFCISEDGENMYPHADSQTPQCSEAEGGCAACWANEMGSAETGRGKACKNIRRLMLVTEDALESAEALEEAEVRLCKVPVTSANNWAKFVNRIADEMDRPSWGVIVLIKLVPDAKTQFKMQFVFEELINFDQPLFDAMQSKIAEVSKDIVAPYAVPSDEPEAQSRGRNKRSAKSTTTPAGKRTPGNRGVVKRGGAAKRSKF